MNTQAKGVNSTIDVVDTTTPTTPRLFGTGTLVYPTNTMPHANNICIIVRVPVLDNVALRLSDMNMDEVGLYYAVPKGLKVHLRNT